MSTEHNDVSPVENERCLIKFKFARLRWGGGLKVEVALLREGSRGRVFF